MWMTWAVEVFEDLKEEFVGKAVDGGHGLAVRVASWTGYSKYFQANFSNFRP